MKFKTQKGRADKLAEIHAQQERLAMIEEVLNTKGYKEILAPALEKKMREHSQVGDRGEQSFTEFGMAVEVSGKIRRALVQTLQMLPKEAERIRGYLSENPLPEGDD